MFAGFNDAARLVLRLAELEARGRGRASIDTDDVLLALVQLHGCVAARVLARCRIDPQEVAREVRAARPAAAGDGGGRLTPAASKAIELARAAASERLGHATVGTGHLLLGLLEQWDGVACRVLCRLGVGRLGGNLSRVAEHVVEEMGGSCVRGERRI